MEPTFQQELVVRYSARLMTVSRRYCRDLAMAEDNLQDSLINILRHIINYEERGSFESWMTRIVINTALKSFKKSSFKNEVMDLEQVPITPIDPEVYSKMGAEELMALINKLPHGFREVFNLYSIEGYSHKEITALLGITESTSRSQLTRARALLRSQLVAKESKSRTAV
jgi:RNA polymerase sigma factor (sigma-70 family)